MTSPVRHEPVPAAYREFFDDASTFPPGSLPLDQAIRAHLARRPNPLHAAVGPAVLPLDALEEAKILAGAHELDGQPIRVSIVVPPGRLAEALRWRTLGAPQLRVDALELKVDPADTEAWREQVAAAAAVRDLDVYVELSDAHIAHDGLSLLAHWGLRLKYRTGGIAAQFFPGIRQLAAVIQAAVAAEVPFKLTAGLHRAVRYTDPATGFTHHGFLNIAVATQAAQAGAGTRELEQLLAESDAAKLAAQVNDAPAWRDAFTSFGTCSVREPAQTLNELGLFPAGLS